MIQSRGYGKDHALPRSMGIHLNMTCRNCTGSRVAAGVVI
jgi:hypothetical protein